MTKTKSVGIQLHHGRQEEVGLAVGSAVTKLGGSRRELVDERERVQVQGNLT